MKLTTVDKLYLTNCGYLDKDFPQIEKAAQKRYTNYEVDGESTPRDKVVQLLGREKYWSGIARSAFHGSSVRQSDDGTEVYFDSSKLFKS